MTQLRLPLTPTSRGAAIALAVAHLVVAIEAEESHDPAMLRQFVAFHARNPIVYDLVERYAIQVADQRKQFGIKAVWEQVRWHLAFETTDAEFKLNNNYHAYYARLFMLHHPEHATLFATRQLGRRVSTTEETLP